MPVPFLDTNIIIRLLTQDDPEKFAACKALFERIERGETTVFLPDVIVGECIFVLTSTRGYNLSRQEVAELLTPLLQLTHVERNVRASTFTWTFPFATLFRLASSLPA